MKPIQKRMAVALSVVALLSLSACAGMTAREKNTAIGAAVGGVAGSVLSNGSGIGTVGGAAVGGIIGNEVGKRR